MTTSSTEICNLALDLLSSETILNVVDPSNPTEDLLNRWYDKSRKKVLRAYGWNFAKDRAVLSASSDTPAFGYTAKFRVPSDCLRILTMEDGDGFHVWKDQYKYENSHILYNGTTVRLIYIKDYTDVPTMDDLFIDLLVCEIGLGIAYKQSGSNSDVDRLLKLKKDSERTAKSIDGKENPPVRIERSKMMQARRTGSGRTDIF